MVHLLHGKNVKSTNLAKLPAVDRACYYDTIGQYGALRIDPIDEIEPDFDLKMQVQAQVGAVMVQKIMHQHMDCLGAFGRSSMACAPQSVESARRRLHCLVAHANWCRLDPLAWRILFEKYVSACARARVCVCL